MRRPKRRAILITAATGVLLAVSGTAMAAFVSTGTGTGAATAGAVQAPTVTGSLSAGQALRPGLTRNMRVVVVNPNNFALQVTRVARSPNMVVVDAAHATGCVNTGVELTNAIFNVFWTVPAGSSRTFTLTNGMRMTNASDNGCQGATFTLPMGVTAVAQ